MKNILILLGLFVCVTGYSQSVFEPASARNEHYCTEFDIVVHSKFTNNFNTNKLKFIRIQKTVSSKWTTAYCDCDLCHDIKTDTAKFELAIGASCETSAHFYPDSSKGIGLVKIKVFPENDPSTFVIGEYQASCWGLSATFIENNKLALSPNPANTVLNIGFGSAEPYTISIIGSDGKLIVKEKVETLTNALDISLYNSGLYSVKVVSAGKEYYSKFIKL